MILTILITFDLVFICRIIYDKLTKKYQTGHFQIVCSIIIIAPLFDLAPVAILLFFHKKNFETVKFRSDTE